VGSLYKGKLIASIKGKTHPIEVYENWRFRWLSFGSHYIQTVINKHYPSKPVLGYLKAFCLFIQENPDSTLLLGVGGGAVLHYLESLIGNYPIKAIEIDNDVIQIAHNYFYLSKLENCDIIKADAFDYVKSQYHCYHHILIDLYQCLDYPSQCSTIEFFKHCYDNLADYGVLSLNIVEFDSQKDLLEIIKQQFNNQVILIPVKNRSNIILHAVKNNIMANQAKSLVNKKLLKKIQWHQDYGLIGFLSSKL
jgi:spermidine synthase